MREAHSIKEFLTTSDGRRVGYRREGQGPLLICHPGGPGFSSLYFGELAGLGADFTLILLDRVVPPSPIDPSTHGRT